MQYSIPDYYKEFECLADACEDTCCAGWQIVVDKKALKKYKKEKSDYRKTLKESIDFKNETFKQDEHKRCAFLNDRNLCEMYLHLGPESLCKTCRMYPRHVEEFENVREITLSVSCPEVARILLSKTEPVRFITREKEGDEEYEDFDPFLYSQLVEARKVIRGILQDRSKPIEVRALLVLGLAHDMQVRIQRSELFACEEVWNKYQRPKATEFAEKKLLELAEDRKKQYAYSRKVFRELYQLELLHEDWNHHLRETEVILYGERDEGYSRLHQEFTEWLLANGDELTVQCEQLLVYFIHTYFCGGVYDGRVFDKVNMSVAGVFLIYEMLTACFKKNGGVLDLEDVITIVYRFSREIEHSDDNIGRMEKLPSLLQFF